jgi:Second Messenger Oligonucleotide or Dinucleotide Synthetase domain
MKVSQRFAKFQENIVLMSDQIADGVLKHSGVRKCLNNKYYNSSSSDENSLLVGAWGKDTRVRPTRNIDLFFVLPQSVYERYEAKSGNRQEQLLQEIREVLSGSYNVTAMRDDRQAALIPFTTQTVEVVPAFLQEDGRYWICDTKSGGSYKTVDPVYERSALDESDMATGGNTRKLIRMLKKWQEHCSVELKSFWIELLAVEFLTTWEFRANSSGYYDWMVRDFFQFLIGRANGYLILRTTYECIVLGDAWKVKAETAFVRAVKACDYEAIDNNTDAWWEWRNIFGPDVPMN